MSFNDGFCFLRGGSRTETFWHDQGNAIIIAGQSRFRLYQGMLASKKDTKIFRRIEAKAQPPKQGSGILDVVNTNDSALDMYHFLRAFYDGLQNSIIKSNEADYFDTIAGILRLGVKYEVHEFERYMVNELSAYYPRKLDEYTRRKLPQSPSFHIEALNLIHETGIEQFVDTIICTIATTFTPTQVIFGRGGAKITSRTLRLRCLNNMRVATVTLSTSLVRASTANSGNHDGLQLLHSQISPSSRQNPTSQLDSLGTLSLPRRNLENRRYKDGIALWRMMLRDSFWLRVSRIIISTTKGLLLAPINIIWRTVSGPFSKGVAYAESPMSRKDPSIAESSRFCQTEEGKTVSLYFEDGDLVIGAQRTIFCVYAGILKNKSGAFDSMFDTSSASGQTMYDGKPCVELDQENAADLYYFLLTLHRPNYSLEFGQSRTFEEIAGVLRLGMKYDVPDLCREMAREIDNYFPTSLEAFQVRDEEFDKLGRPFRLIETALKPNSPIYINLPSILYACYSNYGAQESYETLERLGLLDTSLGRDYMEAITYRLSLRELYIVGSALKGHSSCISERCKSRRPWVVWKLDAKFGQRFRLNLKETSFLKAFGFYLCDHCQRAAQQVLDREIRSLWEDLPRYFLSSDWHTLRAEARRNMLV